MDHILNDRAEGIDWSSYQVYVESIRDRLPAHVYSFASDPQYFDFDSPSTLHDSELESLTIRESGKRDSRDSSQIEIYLRGSRRIRLEYKGVTQYSLVASPSSGEAGNVAMPNGDLFAHEIRLGSDGLLIHELLFGEVDRPVTFVIECTEFNHSEETFKAELLENLELAGQMFDEGRKLFESADYARALEFFRKSKKHWSHFKTYELTEVEAELDENLELAGQMFDEGRKLFNAADYAGALEFFQKSKKHSAHYKTYELMGICLMKLERFVEAIEPLAAATTLNKGVRPPSLLAEALLKVNGPHFLEDTEAAALIALERAPHNKTALKVMQQIEEYKRKEAEKNLQMKPRNRGNRLP